MLKTHGSQPIGLYILLLSLSVFGCGGGGGSNGSTQSPATPPVTTGATLSGTAATGQPIQGTVYIRGAQGMEINTLIDAGGFFKAVVDGLSPPFMLRAIPSNGGATQYSYAATANQTVNITPLTSLVLLLASNNQALSQLYANWPGSQGVVTASGLSQAQSQVNQTFQSQYTAAGINNPLFYNVFSTVFQANAQGIDAVLDVLQLFFDPAAGTVTYRNGSGNRQPFNLTNPVNRTHILGPKNVFGLPASGRVDLSEYHADLVFKLILLVHSGSIYYTNTPVDATSFDETIDNGVLVNQNVQSGDRITCYDDTLTGIIPRGSRKVFWDQTGGAVNQFQSRYILNDCSSSAVNQRRGTFDIPEPFFTGEYAVRGVVDGATMRATVTAKNLRVENHDGTHHFSFDGTLRSTFTLGAVSVETATIDPSGLRIRDEDNTFPDEGLYIENITINQARMVKVGGKVTELFMVITSDNNNQSRYQMQVDLLPPKPSDGPNDWGFTIRQSPNRPPGVTVDLRSIVTVELTSLNGMLPGSDAIVSVDENGDGFVDTSGLLERVSTTIREAWD